MPVRYKLTPSLIDRKIGTKRGRYSDGAGLYLQVGPTGGRSWLFQFTSQGRERQLGLGSADVVTLKQARDKAQAARDLIAAGIDPIDAKREHRRAALVGKAKPITFEAAARDFIAAHSPAWKNAKHREQWTSTLEAYAFPLIGKKSVAEIDTSLILKILKPIWNEKPETAGRVRGRVENILNAAKAEGLRSGDNPAAWAGHLDHLLPAPSKIRIVRHHPAMPYSEMPRFLKTLQKREGISARALEVLILTVARTGELIGMRDDEIDFAEKVWTVPATRMKAGKEHLVPLCDRAIKILRAVPREKGNPYFFTGLRTKTHISNMSMLALMKHIAQDFTPHGFRSTFTDWANETTPTPHHVVEMALAHTIKSQTERAYRRGALFAKRRELMAAWEAYLYPKTGKP